MIDIQVAVSVLKVLLECGLTHLLTYCLAVWRSNDRVSDGDHMACKAEDNSLSVQLANPCSGYLGAHRRHKTGCPGRGGVQRLGRQHMPPEAGDLVPGRVRKHWCPPEGTRRTKGLEKERGGEDPGRPPAGAFNPTARARPSSAGGGGAGCGARETGCGPK